MKKISGYIRKAFSTLADCIIPTLPMMIGVGMIKLFLIILSPMVLNVLSYDSSSYIVLSFVADAGYYFLPIFIAISAADVFKTNRYVAGALGGMLLSPTFIEYVESGESLSVFSLPVTMTNYGSQILPSVLIVWLFSYIYNFLDSHINEKIKSVFVSFLSILIMIPVSYCLVGPIGVWLGKLLIKLIDLLFGLGPIGAGIYCALLPFICILGVGGVNLTICVSILAQGPDPNCFYPCVMYNVLLGVVVFVFYLKSKDNDAIATSITATVAGISEPALFGVVVKHTYLLIPLCLSCFVSGFMCSLFNIYSYAMTTQSVFGILATIGEKTPFIYSLITMAVGTIIAIISTFITLKKAHD